MKQYVIITGDKHGDFSSLYRMDNPDNKPVIIVGDFGGIWASSLSHIAKESMELDKLSELPFDIFFIDGNHENFTRLYEFPVVEKHGGLCHQLRKNIFHMKRGEIFTIEGIRFFAFGGAYSHDVQYGILDPNKPDFERKVRRLRRHGIISGYRVKGYSWWEEEKPNDEEMAIALENLKKVDYKVDVVLTHQAPSRFERLLPFPIEEGNTTLENYFPDFWKFPDFLTRLLITVEFKQWYFGHYHTDSYVQYSTDVYVRNIYDEFRKIEKED